MRCNYKLFFELIWIFKPPAVGAGATFWQHANTEIHRNSTTKVFKCQKNVFNQTANRLTLPIWNKANAGL